MHPLRYSHPLFTPRLFGKSPTHAGGDGREEGSSRVLHHRVLVSSLFLLLLLFFRFWFFFLFFFVGASLGGGGFLSGSQNLPKVLPAPGGTNPYPLAPTMTPLVSAVLGGGPGGNNTGPA